MTSRTPRFEITNDVQVRLEASRNRVVISRQTEDGKALELVAHYDTIDRIHQLQQLLNR